MKSLYAVAATDVAVAVAEMVADGSYQSSRCAMAAVSKNFEERCWTAGVDIAAS
jgi:hypothetical protein